MRSRMFSVLPLAVALIVCAVLTARWVQGRARSEQLTAELDEVRRAADARTTAHATHAALPAPAETVATLDPELEARKALLAEARAIPELARREAALLAVRRIKAQHKAAPPPPRVLPPPFNAKYSAYFTELFSDPQYLALVREDWQTGYGSAKAEHLRNLDISDETKRQVLDLEFDSFLANNEAGAYTTVEERQAALQERTRIRKENEARIRQLLGDNGLQAHNTAPPSQATASTDPASRVTATQIPLPDVASGPLAVRLSYTDSPLTESDQDKLQALLSAMATPKNPVYRLWYDVEFFKQAQSILNPTQLAALRELQEENEARALRSRLPKASELPRTTRRARLEPGD